MAAVRKNAREPSLAVSVFLGLIVALIGVVLGAGYMMALPATHYPSVEEREKALEATSESEVIRPPDLYYYKGSVARTAQWTQKRATFVGGSATEVRVSSEQVNAWMSSSFRKPSQKKEEEASGLLLFPSPPNFYFDGDKNVHMSVDLAVDYNGREFAVTATAIGSFERSNPNGFTIQRVRLNSALVPPFLSQRVMDLILATFQETEEYQTLKDAWRKLRSVEIVDDAVVLRLR